MKTSRLAFAAGTAAAVVLALGSCSSAGDAGPAAPAPAPAAGTAEQATPAPGAPSAATTADEAEVETAFRTYTQALLDRDFATACSLNAPEATAKLVETFAAQGVTVNSCEEAVGTLFSTPGFGDAADEVARSFQVTDVAVDGDQATVNLSVRTQGRQQDVQSGLRRVDGRWLLLSAAP